MDDFELQFFGFPGRPHADPDGRKAAAKLGVVSKGAGGLRRYACDGENDLDGSAQIEKILAADSTTETAALGDRFKQACLTAAIGCDDECRGAIEIETEALEAAEVLDFDAPEFQGSPVARGPCRGLKGIAYSPGDCGRAARRRSPSSAIRSRLKSPEDGVT